MSITTPYDQKDCTRKKEMAERRVQKISTDKFNCPEVQVATRESGYRKVVASKQLYKKPDTNSNTNAICVSAPERRRSTVLVAKKKQTLTSHRGQ